MSLNSHIHFFNSFQFNLIQFNFILLYFKKKPWSRTLSILNYFRSKCLFPPWYWVILFHFQFNYFLFVIFQKRICSRTLSILNYFRSKCLFPPWSCLFQFNSIKSNLIKFKWIHFNLIQFNFILFSLFYLFNYEINFVNFR